METKNFYERLRDLQLAFRDMKKTGYNDNGGKSKPYDYLELSAIYNKLKDEAFNSNILIMAHDDKDYPISEDINANGTMYTVGFRKQYLIIDVVTGKTEFSLYTYAYGTNKTKDKAKGTADTYATRYFLQQLLQISDDKLDSNHMENEQNKPQKQKDVLKDEQGNVIWQPSPKQMQLVKNICKNNNTLGIELKMGMQELELSSPTEYVTIKGKDWLQEFIKKGL